MHIRNHDSSLRGQSPLGDAKDSVSKAHNAVSEALSNPQEEFLEDAGRAIAKAQLAVSAAIGDDNQMAAEQAAASLKDAENRLEQAKGVAREGHADANPFT